MRTIDDLWEYGRSVSVLAGWLAVFRVAVCVDAVKSILAG